MRRDDVQAWNAALLLFVMLLTVGTLGAHTFRRATDARALGRIGAEPWTLTAPSAGVATVSARRAGTRVPPEAALAVGRGTRAPGEALMLLMLIGQGARAGISMTR